MRNSALGAALLLALWSCKFSTTGLGLNSSSEPDGQPAAQPGNVRIPNMFRMQKDAALAALKRAGFQGSVSDDSSLCGSVVEGQIIELGEVCYHHPVAGAEQPARLPLTLRVQTEDPRHGRIGDHLEWHLMPDVIGMPLARAKQAMKDAGFTEERTRISVRDDGGCKPLHVCQTFPEVLTRSGINSDRVLIVQADPSTTKKPEPARPEVPASDSEQAPPPKEPKPDAARDTGEDPDHDTDTEDTNPIVEDDDYF